MNPLSKFGRIVSASGLVLALASACGGRSFTQNGDDDGGSAGAGANASAGKGSAGKASGGSLSTGGTGSAGIANASGSGTTAGAGATASDGCSEAADPGNCDGLNWAWYHDRSTGVCRPFAYGGCGGNANRYGSLADCQKACPGGSPNYDSCNDPTECIVVGNGCCGVCDGPNVGARDLIAYNRQYQGQLSCGFLLEAPAPGANIPACAPCLPPDESTLKYFVPDCVNGQCTVVDLRSSPLTQCMTGDDCRLRHGKSCCESCGDSNDLIALRKDVSFERLVCGPGDVACPACAPTPTSAVAECSNGRCEVAYHVTTE
jgi:trypsin inhibitor